MNQRKKTALYIFMIAVYLYGFLLYKPIEVSAEAIGTINTTYNKINETTAVITVQTSNVARTRLPDGNWSTQSNFTYTVSKNGVFDFEGEVVGGDRVQSSLTVNNLRQNIHITNNKNVSLRLKSDDTLSGVTYMRFKNESSGVWSAYEPYSLSKSWSVNNSEGLKTVYVQYKDLAGNESTPNTDKIYLDLAPPTVSFTINNGQQYTNNNRVTLNFNITDTISSISTIMISNDNVNWTEIPFTASTAWTIPANIGNRTVYVKAKDSVGNISPSISRNIYYDNILPTGDILINNGDTTTNTRDVTLTLNFNDSHSGVKKVRVLEEENIYEFPNVPTSPATIPWTLRMANTAKVTLEVTDKAGNVYRIDSNTINIITLKFTEFKLTNVVNPLVFTPQNPFTPKSWSFAPQPMMSGGEIRFEAYYDLYDQGAISSTTSGKYTVELVGQNYHETVDVNFLDKITVPGRGFRASFILPNDAPINTKVYVKAQIDATVRTTNSSATQTDYFPGPENETKAQIGYIQANIKDTLIFNEAR